MELLPSELIRKKRFGGEHTRGEIRALVRGYAGDEIPDYQMAAWLMAVCFRGMTAAETLAFTLEMRDSGVTLDLAALGVTVDKHSTGGIGDKTSLILAPLVASCGIPVPMMAGRGLGHTGGTLDKLESIRGFDVRLDLERFRECVAKVGTAIVGQTGQMCPADRKLYALRDVTGTIDSLPLICGSIMSKKLAEGMSALVLDVKFGSGAFMKNEEEAERLARALADIGGGAGKRVRALLTRMDEPLGRFVGNALEVAECVDLMAARPPAGPGKDYADTRELTLALAAQMIFLGGKAATPEAGRAVAEKKLEDGSAWRKFVEMCRAQGASVPDSPEDFVRALPRASAREAVAADGDGFVRFVDLEKVGLAGVHLGAGRRFQNDALDFAAGIETLVTQGQRVAKGEPLFAIHHSDAARARAALPVLRQAYRIEPQPVPRSPLIAKVI